MSKNRASEVWKEIKPFAIRDMNSMIDSKSGEGGDDLYAIILYDESAQKIKYYSMSAEGLYAALAAASSGDVVFVPAGTIETGLGYILGDEITSAAITVYNNDIGDEITGLTIGELYAIEAFNGPWYSAPDGSFGQPVNDDRKNYSFYVNEDTNWPSVGQIGLGWDPLGGNDPFWNEDMPEFGVHIEAVTTQYARLYFVAPSTSIRIRVGDFTGSFDNDSGTLSYKLSNAEYSPNISVPSGVELIGLGENTIIDGSVANNGIITNIQITGGITGSGISRMVNNQEDEVFSNKIRSLVATGTAPFSVASTTLVTNLNADMVDGLHAEDLAKNIYDGATTKLSIFGLASETTFNSETYNQLGYIKPDISVGTIKYVYDLAQGNSAIIAQFISDELGITTIPAGPYEFTLNWRKTTYTENGGLQIMVFRVYTVDTSFNETLILSCNFPLIADEASPTAGASYTSKKIENLSSDVSILETDRLKIEIEVFNNYSITTTYAVYFGDMYHELRLEAPYMGINVDFSGYMEKSIYDVNGDGVVDEAENASAIDGVEVDLTGITDGQSLIYDLATTSIIPGESGGGGHIIEDEGTPLTQRANLNFVGSNVEVTDDSGNDRTVVTISNLSISGNVSPSICQGRLTLESGVPVSSTNQSGKTTLYFTPYDGNMIGLFDGTDTWTVYAIAEKSIAIPATTNTNYDVFMYDNAGTPTLELLAWTDATTRATALTTQDGILVKTGATTRRYLGTIRTIGTSGQCEDTLTKRFVWNYYNRADRPLQVSGTDLSSSSTSWQIRGSVYVVIGIKGDTVYCTHSVGITDNLHFAGILLDGSDFSTYGSPDNPNDCTFPGLTIIPIGYHTISCAFRSRSGGSVHYWGGTLNGNFKA